MVEEPQIQPRVGALALAARKVFPLVVCKSAAGYYIGTRDEEGAPFSRESREYWPRSDDASQALTEGVWTQRVTP